MVHHFAIVVDGDVSGVEFKDLGSSQLPIKGDAFNDAELVRELFIQFADFSLPDTARMTEKFLFDQRDCAAHETAGVIVGNAPLRCRDDEVGGEGNGHEGAHGQQIEIEKQLGEAVTTASPAWQRDPEKGANEAWPLVAGISSSHAC